MNLRALVAIVSALVGLPSFAQATHVPGFDLDRLTPDPGNAASLIVNSGENLPKGTLKFTLLGEYQHDPLVYYVDDKRIGSVVGYRVSAHLGVAYSIFDWVQVAAMVPVVLTQGGDNLTSQNIAPVQSTAMGAPLIQGRFQLLQESSKMPVDLALTVGLTLPLGSSNALTRDPDSGFSLIPQLGVGHTFGIIRVGANVGANVRSERVLSPYAEAVDDEIGSLISLAATASTTGTGLRGEIDVRGLIPLSSTNSEVEILAGLHYPFFHQAFEVFALGGPGFGRMPGTPGFRVMAGLSYSPLQGVRCVEGEDYPIASCPSLDRDGDGVRNSDDHCPTEFGPAEQQGCPLKIVKLEPEPAKPEPKKEEPKPEPVVKTVIIHEVVEKEVVRPEPVKPEPPPEPGKPHVEIVANKLVLSDKVYFETGSAKLRNVSQGLLEVVAATLKSHPEVAHVRIEGHTDNSGKRSFNIDLSSRRADSVRSFLIDHGVDSSRLSSKGFGPDAPIASNAMAKGREENRRVEFIIQP